MVKDVVKMALYMLNMTDEVARLEAGESDGNIANFVRYFNLVHDEISVEYLFTDDGTMKEYSLESVFTAIDGVSNRVIAYGVAAEHCITIAHTDASMWDKRYKDGLAMAKKNAVNIPARRFFEGG